jgi:hypothetical protein
MHPLVAAERIQELLLSDVSAPIDIHQGQEVMLVVSAGLWKHLVQRKQNRGRSVKNRRGSERIEIT